MEVQGNVFWLVWREGSRDVGYKHATRQEADTEAKRLAGQMPGELFYVVKTAAAYARPIGDVTRAKLSELPGSINTPYPQPADDDIPF